MSAAAGQTGQARTIGAQSGLENAEGGQMVGLSQIEHLGQPTPGPGLHVRIQGEKKRRVHVSGKPVQCCAMLR